MGVQTNRQPLAKIGGMESTSQLPYAEIGAFDQTLTLRPGVPVFACYISIDTRILALTMTHDIRRIVCTFVQKVLYRVM